MDLPDWMSFDLDLDNDWILSIGLGLILGFLCFWAGGMFFGLKTFPMMEKIICTILMVPITYFVIQFMKK